MLLIRYVRGPVQDLVLCNSLHCSEYRMLRLLDTGYRFSQFLDRLAQTLEFISVLDGDLAGYLMSLCFDNALGL